MYLICNYLSRRQTADLFDKKNPDWIPTSRMGHSKKVPDAEQAVNRYHRAQERKQKRERFAAADGLLSLKTQKKQKCNPHEDAENTDDLDLQDELHDELNSSLIDNVAEINSSNLSELNDCNVQTDLTLSNVSAIEDELTRLNKELYDLRDENKKLKVGTSAWFQGKDEKVNFYTGLPSFKILMVLFNYLSVVLPRSANTILTPFQEFVLALMRLRLNLTLNDLGYRFNVSKTTASTVFLKWLDIMFVRLKPLIKWPEHEQLWETTPLCFRKHFKPKLP